MSEAKRYFHELSQDEVEKLINDGKTWGDIQKDFLQPDWCTYPEGLMGQMGCWSLTDISRDGLRQKISIEFCKDCDCFKPKQTV